MENKTNQNTSGLNLDAVNWQIKEGLLTFALNSNIQSHDGNTLTYTNEPSNQICFDFETILPGFKILKVLPIIEQQKVVVFLAHPDGRSEIGYISNIGKDCQSVEITEEDCGCAAGVILKSKVLQATEAQPIEGECPVGYNWNDIKKVCEKEVSIPATIGKSTAFEANYIEDTGFQGYLNPYLYDAGWNFDGTGTFTELTASFWTAPSSIINPAAINYLKARAIRPGRNAIADSVWRGVTETFCPTVDKTYYLAISADDSFRVFLDGVKVIEAFGSSTRKIYERIHIYPLAISAGNHTLTFEYKNSQGPDLLFYEIYDATQSQVIGATTGNTLTKVLTCNIDYDLKYFNEISTLCPSGYTLKGLADCTAGCFKMEEVSPATTQVVANCCTYTPLITDECKAHCNDTCEEITVLNNGFGIINFEYIDCSGVTRSKDIPNIGANTETFLSVRKGSYILEEGVTVTSSKLVTDPQKDLKGKEYCCLNLDINYPVDAEYRLDDCKTRIYFVAGNIPPKSFYWTEEDGVVKETLGVDECQKEITCIKDACPNFDMFPSYCQPELFPVAVESGGSLAAGVYSFSIAYSTIDGQELTDYVDLSNPIPIFERTITEQTEYVTSKSIKVRVEHKTSIFNYYNLVVAENINEVTTYHLVGTYKINTDLSDEVVYSGEYKSTFSSVLPLVRTPHYKHATIIEKQNDILMLASLTETPSYNFQLVANQINLEWETVTMPANGKWDYSNPEIAYFFRTYQRDEVYPFGIKFRLKNGKYTDVFHIPGRTITDDDKKTPIAAGKDMFEIDDDCIITDRDLPQWKVYNTGKVIADSVPKTLKDYSEKQYACHIPVKEFGSFSYWESIEKYPCNPEIWGPLADQPIRFHKFPDSFVTHIHDGKDLRDTDIKNNNSTSEIYPIGVRVDEGTFNNLLNTATIYDPLLKKDVPLKDLVCGFELVRGSRVNNKSIIAKGLLYDVGLMALKDRDGNTERSYFYPNYPYNDLRPDPYLSDSVGWYDQGARGATTVDGFGYLWQDEFQYQDRFTFHSPDTHFQYPKIGTELKLETIEYGKVLGHFVPVTNHPEYKFINHGVVDTFITSAALAAAYVTSTQATTTGGQVLTIDIANQIAQTQLLLDLITKLIPYKNFAYQFNSVATYNNYQTVGRFGHSRRVIDLGYYADSKIVNLNDTYPFHNRLRESSVYLKTTNKFRHNPGIVTDNSRYLITQEYSGDDASNPTILRETRDTRAYYSSIKRNFANQYGQIQNVKYISTGYVVDIVDGGAGKVKMESKYYPAFGGDTFINKFALKRKHSFFTRNLATLAAPVNDVPFDYWLNPNLGYPAYYIGNTPEELSFTNPATIITTFAYAIAVATATGVFGGAYTGITMAAALEVVMLSLINLNQPKINLDNFDEGFYQTGQFYTASYGIPIFFVESDINVDFRHGRDDKIENFYPNVGGKVPDDWLEEINVPIKYDNYYHYNATYSAQNQSPNLSYTYPDCINVRPNRVIWSETAKHHQYYSDAWRSFRRNNYYDFPKEGGELVDLNAGENERVYARFENTVKVYNARVVMESTSPVQLEIGNASMFSQKPLELTRSDLGYMGTQHKAIVKTQFGMFWADAKRGSIYQLSAQGFEEITKGSNFNWFRQNLPFEIIKSFPQADIDNPAKGLGISMGWDQRFQRVFITKLDYKPTGAVPLTYVSDPTDVNYGKFIHSTTKVEVLFTDTTAFENKSWTIAYSPVVQNFISFYSFLPNFYIPWIGHFQTVVNTPAGASTWNHNLNPYTYQTYYNKLYPYIIEYSENSMPKTSITNSVSLVQDIQEYFSDYEFYSLATGNNTNLANFTKAIVYNKEQSSGIINLIPEIYGNKAQKIQYPRMSSTGIETLLGRRDNMYFFNGFWTINFQGSGQPIWSTKWSDTQSQYPIDKVPNPKTVLPIAASYQKQKIKSDFCRVRLIQDKYNRYKFINHLQITQIQP